MPHAILRPSARLDASEKLAAATEREAAESAERQRHDEALLSTFKEQVRRWWPPTPPSMQHTCRR